MTLHGIGLDVVEVERISDLLARQGEAFTRRIFTTAECDYCLSHARPAPHFAARFAAKEAVAKAFGTGIGKHAAFREIEVIRTASGAPGILLHGAAADYAASCGIRAIFITLTHTPGYAAANAIATG